MFLSEITSSKLSLTLFSDTSIVHYYGVITGRHAPSSFYSLYTSLYTYIVQNKNFVLFLFAQVYEHP